MTYPIGNVIYGCPFPQGRDGGGPEFEQAMEEWLGHDDFHMLEKEEAESLEGTGREPLWNSCYSASPDMDPAGFYGELLHCADGYWEMKAEWFQEEIPAAARARVDAAWAELPESIKSCLGAPRLAIAWSDS